MSSSAITTQVAQLKIGNVQNQADTSAVYNGGIWSFKNSTALTSVTITNAGNVGISTTNPSAKLHVDAGYDNAAIFKHLYTFGGANYAIAVQGDTSVRGYIAQNPASGGLLLSSGSTYYGGGPSRADGTAACHMSLGSDGAISFATNSGLTAGSNFTPTERMRIDASGNITLGVASGTANTTHVVLNRSTTSSDFVCAFVKGANDTTTSNNFVLFQINNGGANSGAIGANGANSAAFKSFSDRRMKENIVPLSGELSKVLALNPVEFDYKDGSGHQVGFIAQEMEQVYPDVISVLGDTEEMKAISGWDKTSARLVKAIQELSAKVDFQDREIRRLKGEAVEEPVAPAPVIEPAPAPAVEQPAPQPEAQSQSVLQPEPEIQPEPTVQSEPEVQSQSAPQPEEQSAPQPEPEPEVQPEPTVQSEPVAPSEGV